MIRRLTSLAFVLNNTTRYQIGGKGKFLFSSLTDVLINSISDPIFSIWEKSRNGNTDSVGLR